MSLLIQGHSTPYYLIVRFSEGLLDYTLYALTISFVVLACWKASSVATVCFRRIVLPCVRFNLLITNTLI